MSPEIILASSSSGRRELLNRLQIAYSAITPDVDETPQPGESAPHLAQRLAELKAETVAAAHPESIVIGSDQVADINGVIVGKPGSLKAARAQLRAQSGRTVLFHTGVAVVAPKFDHTRSQLETVTTQFRDLTEAQIDAYVLADDPTQTAGSLKSEGLGITLLASVESRDPTALIGMSLIQLTDLLLAADVSLPP